MIKKCLFVLIFFYVITNSINDYGPFDLILTEFKKCKGPRRTNCSVDVVRIVNGNNLKYNLTIKQNVGPLKGKIIGYTNSKEIIKVQITKPCNHIFMRPLLQSLFNLTDNCIILKGQYVFSINIEETARNYYAGSFLYGNWTYRILFYNDECNFTCTVLKMTISPKKSKVTN